MQHAHTGKHAVWRATHTFFSLAEKTSLSTCFGFGFWSLTSILMMAGRGRGLASVFLVEINQTKSRGAAGGDPSSFLHSTPSPRAEPVSCQQEKICLHLATQPVTLNLPSCCSFSQHCWYFLHLPVTAVFSRHKGSHHCALVTNWGWGSDAKSSSSNSTLKSFFTPLCKGRKGCGDIQGFCFDLDLPRCRNYTEGFSFICSILWFRHFGNVNNAQSILLQHLPIRAA